ncbi:MAG: amidohydrolase family protein [Methanomicrobiales archaeon]
MTYILIHNGTIIDGTGKNPLKNGSILLKDNKIIQVSKKDLLDLPDDKIIEIDAENGYILPGFIDTHVHLLFDGFSFDKIIYTPLSLYFYKAIKNMLLTLNAGVTTVRDAGMADIGLKLAVEQNLIKGPRMQISVAPLSITGGHFDLMLNTGFDATIKYPGFPDARCDGVENVRKKVREVLRAGADVIKVMTTGGVISPNDRSEYTQFTQEEIKVMVEEGEYREGVKVMAHAHGTQGIKNAVKAGVHSVEHGTYLDDECIDLMLSKDTYLIPTLYVIKYNGEIAKSGLGDLPDWLHNQAIEIVDIHRQNIIKAYQMGVKIVMGTDCGIAPHGNNLQELGLLCDVGMSPMESIMAGTKNAAKCLGWEDQIGTLEQGKLADIVICKKDPLKDIDVLADHKNIIMVIKDGVVVKNISKSKL